MKKKTDGLLDEGLKATQSPKTFCESQSLIQPLEKTLGWGHFYFKEYLFLVEVTS